MPGGAGPVLLATPDTQAICDAVREQAYALAQQQGWTFAGVPGAPGFPEFRAHSYRSQVVAGATLRSFRCFC